MAASVAMTTMPWETYNMNSVCRYFFRVFVIIDECVFMD